MIHKDVYTMFEAYFPEVAAKVDVWFPNGKDSVRVRLTSKREFIFSYINDNHWSFETIDSFLEKLKGDKKMR